MVSEGSRSVDSAQLLVVPHHHSVREVASQASALRTPADFFGHTEEEIKDLARTRFHGGDYIVSCETMLAALSPSRNAIRLVVRNALNELKQLILDHNCRTNYGGYLFMQAIGGDSPQVASRTATGVTATTLTDTGASFPASTSSNAGTGLVAHLVQMGGVYMVVLSNTGTALTGDKWYNPASPGGAAASTPTAGEYLVLPGMAPSRWIAFSTDATTEDISNTTLPSEITSGFTTTGRWFGSYSVGTAPSGTGTTNSTAAQILDAGVLSANASNTITKLGLTPFQNGGWMSHVKKLPSAATVSSGDTVDPSWTIQNT